MNTLVKQIREKKRDRKKKKEREGERARAECRREIDKRSPSEKMKALRVNLKDRSRSSETLSCSIKSTARDNNNGNKCEIMYISIK